jgi:hypothetical protein
MIGFISTWLHTHSLLHSIQRYCSFKPFTDHRCTCTRMHCFHYSSPSNALNTETTSLTFQILHINQVFQSHVNSSQADLLFPSVLLVQFALLFASFCRDYYSLVTELKLSLRSLFLIWNSPRYKLNWTLTRVALYKIRTDHTQKTQLYCWLAPTAQKISHVAPIVWFYWRAVRRLATSYKHS